jgi:hypothetical protein
MKPSLLDHREVINTTIKGEENIREQEVSSLIERAK